MLARARIRIVLVLLSRRRWPAGSTLKECADFLARFSSQSGALGFILCNMTRKVLVPRDPICLEHRPAGGHPESPERLAAVYADLDAKPVPGIHMVSPRKATREELLRVHSPRYLEKIEETSGTKSPIWLDPDTCASEHSHEAALIAAGALCMSVEEVLSGRFDSAFALVRPPGHHAEPDTVMGFCLFNNVAVAAAKALAEHGLKRILVLDPDVHHGNGTQQAFWKSSKVLYVSTHRYPFYPGTGWFDEIGMGEGSGYTMNIPLPYGSGDADLLHVYREAVEPVVEAFRPELILVSAGFDTDKLDPLGGFEMTVAGYSALYGLFLSWAQRFSEGRMILALEGGYSATALVRAVRCLLELLTGARTPEEDVPGSPSDLARQAASKALSMRHMAQATG